MSMVTAGYIELCDLFANDNFDINFAVYYKFMPASPDANAVSTGSGNSSAYSALSIGVFRGVDLTTPMDVTATFTSGINSDIPDPPSITPANANTMIVACGGSTEGTIGPTAPTGYANLRWTRIGTGAGNYTGSGFATKAGPGAGVPEDPGVFNGFGTATTTEAWAACTIALRAAASGTLFNQTVTVTATTSVALAKAAGKLLAVSAARTVVMTKAVAKGIAVSAARTVAMTKAVAKTITAIATSSTVVAASRLFLKTIAVTVTSSVVVTKARTVVQVVAATATSSVALAKQVGKIVTISATRVVVVAKQVGKRVAATATSSTVFVASRLFLKTITVTATTSTTVLKAVAKAIAGTAIAVVSVRKALGKIVTISATRTVAIAKGVGKRVTVVGTTATTVAGVFHAFVAQSLVYASLGFRPIVNAMSIVLDKLLSGEVSSRPVSKSGMELEPLTDAGSETEPAVRGKPSEAEEP